MTKELLYQYIGTNGSILSPIHLIGASYVPMLRLTADEGKMLTKDDKKFELSVIISEEDEEKWHEVEV